MPVPRLRRLLSQLDEGTYGDRVRTMARLGRDHRDDPGDEAFGRLLDDLAATSEHHRYLAMVAAAVAGDRGRLVSTLDHPTPRLRAAALRLLAAAGEADAEVADRVRHGSTDERRQARRILAQRGPSAAADDAIDEVRDRFGDREAAGLLLACRGDVVRRLLPELADAVPSVRALAQRHPGPVLEHLATSLPELPARRRDERWRRFDAALVPLVDADAAGVLELLERAGPAEVLPRGLAPRMGRLLRTFPERIGALVVEPHHVATLGWRLPSWLRRHGHRLVAADRVTLARSLRAQDDLLFALLDALPPRDRPGVLAAALEDEAAGRVFAPHHLAVLPHAARQAEARRTLALRAIATDHGRRLPYVALLPYAEARPVLALELARSTPEERTVGYALLVECARHERDPAALDDVLDLLPRLANEQDPVRQAAARALAGIPARRFTDADLGRLRGFVRSVTEARDSSFGTIQPLARLALALVADAAAGPTSTRFRAGLDLVDGLAAPTGRLTLPRLDHVLPRGAERALVDALIPRLDRDARRGVHRFTLALAEALGRRAWALDDLQERVGRATTVSDDAVVRWAVAVWLADPRTRSTRVGELVGRDPSMLTLPGVTDTVARRRQDLLDVLLRPRPLRGRFATGDVRFVPILPGPFERWLPRQVQAYQGAIEALVATPGTPSQTRAWAVRTLGRLPEVGVPALATYLSSEEIPVVEAALAAVASTDRPSEALDVLLAEASTDRARVALYAAGRCVRLLRPAELGPPLLSVLHLDGAKVTARKEVVRLLGRHRPPGWLDALGTIGVDPAVHRDVRIAAGRSVLDALDHEVSWSVLDALAASGDDERRSVLLTGPNQVPPRHRARYAALVQRCADDAHPPLRTPAVVAVGEWAPWAPTAPTQLADIVDDLDAGPEWWMATQALGRVLADGVGWGEVAGLLDDLADRADRLSSPEPVAAGADAGDVDDGFDAGADRDRPAAQRLDAMVAVLADLPTRDRAGHRVELGALADALGRRRAHVLAEVRLRSAALDPTDPIPALTAVAASLDARPLLAAEASRLVAEAVERDAIEWDDGRLAPAVDHLLDLGTTGAGLVALRLVQLAGDRTSWPEGWRARLRTLRRHPDPDVALLATHVHTAPE